MISPKFLILVEGENDVNDLFKIIEIHLEDIVGSKKVNIVKDKRRNTIIIKSELDEITIYIKNSISQNLPEHIELLRDNSIEKVYEIKDHITAVYSIYDLDHKSKSPSHHKEYFQLIDNGDNYYPILSYSGFEAHYIQDVQKIMRTDIEKLKAEERLDNINELLENFDINESCIKLKMKEDISAQVKKFVKQLRRSNFYKEYAKNTNKIYSENLEYIYNYFEEKDYMYFLENQDKVYNKAFLDNKIILASFINCVVEDIHAWINNEEEEE